MDLKHGDDIYDSFRAYQNKLLREYSSMADEFHFRTVDARRSVDRIQDELRRQVAGVPRADEQPSEPALSGQIPAVSAEIYTAETAARQSRRYAGRMAAAGSTSWRLSPATPLRSRPRRRRRPARRPKIDVAGLNFYYGAHRVLHDITPADPAEPGHGAHRTVGLRQVDVPALAQPDERHHPGRARRGIGAASTAQDIYALVGRRRRSAAAGRHGVPEVESVSEVDFRERRLRPAHQPA